MKNLVFSVCEVRTGWQFSWMMQRMHNQDQAGNGGKRCGGYSCWRKLKSLFGKQSQEACQQSVISGNENWRWKANAISAALETETEHHALILCPHASALRDAMRDKWALPQEHELMNTGLDWLLLLIDKMNEEEAVQFILLIWRIWYIRNEIVHHKPPRTIEGSVHFLCNYLETLFMV